MQEKYPKLFASKGMNFDVEILLRGRECENLKTILYSSYNFPYFVIKKTNLYFLLD